jgi:1,4-alpha-glucan branching enzyme
MYEDRLHRFRALFVDGWQGELIKAYGDLRDSGHLELTASAATHGLLPLLMRVPEAVQAQVHKHHLQCQAVWLPTLQLLQEG